MILQHQQNSSQHQPNTNPILFQLNSQKTPTHLTIQQENQNPKQAINPKNIQSRTANKNPEEKKFRKLSKQSKKVKSLEEQYRELEEQVREIKELVQLQVEMIDYSTQQINEKYLQTKSHLSQSLTPKSIPPSPSLSIYHLQSCLSKLFSYHETIEAANSNYLLLSQVNKQEESQNIFHIHNLEERIRQLRFLLNGKQDLLAYETATFEGFENFQQDGNDVRKIYIDYHLPRRESLANKNNMESEFRFVEKVVGEMTRLRKSVKQLQDQLSSDSVDSNSQENQENCCFDQKDLIKENYQDLHYNFDSRYATPKTTRNRQIEKVKLFTECQNNLLSAQTSRYQSKTNQTISKKLQNKTLQQLAFLPLSIQNYKHSLIYRVGKLQMVDRLNSKKLQEKYEKLNKQLNLEVETKKRLVKEYELKRDVYQYKKKLLNGKSDETKNNKAKFKKELNRKQNISTDNILDELENPSIRHKESQNLNSLEGNCLLQNNISIQEHPELSSRNSLAKQIQTQEIKIEPFPKSLSIINLSTSQLSRDEKLPSTPQKKIIFQELTNSHHTPNKKSTSNPFLKLKDKDLTRNHFSYHENLSAKTPKKDKKINEDEDKQNSSKKHHVYMKQNQSSTEKHFDHQLDQKHASKIKKELDKQSDQQIPHSNNIVRSKLRRRRQNTRKNLNQNKQTQQSPRQTVEN